ncbi:MAG: ComF family protein [Alkalinema sp. RL_2_19]|nr:ComF family protein [Alkalinema sp. RL_2_19]
MWTQHDLPQLSVVPIPLHPEKQVSRGYNQAELIAQQFSQLTGMRCHPHLLQRPKATQAQHGLRLTERQTNLRSAFTIDRPKLCPHPIVIVDDIYTTGATIQAATECCIANGYTVWGSLIVAQ